jgi:hypothetical protein
MAADRPYGEFYIYSVSLEYIGYHLLITLYCIMLTKSICHGSASRLKNIFETNADYKPWIIMKKVVQN